MRALTLDYLNSGRGPRPAAWVLAALALAFTVDVGVRYADLRQTVARAEVRLARQLSARAELRPYAEARPVGGDEYAFARDTARRLTTPWSALFQALEAAKTDGAALLAVEPDFEQRTVSISGEAKDYLATLTYVANLADQPGLSRVHLVRHEVQRSPPQRVAFTVSAGWKERP